MLGYLKHTAEYVLRLISRGDLWEDMFGTLKSDVNFALPRSTTGGITESSSGLVGEQDADFSLDMQW